MRLRPFQLGLLAPVLAASSVVNGLFAQEDPSKATQVVSIGPKENVKPTRAELYKQKRAVERVSSKLWGSDFEKVKDAVEEMLKTRSVFAAPYFWRLYGGGYGRRRRLALRAIMRLNLPGSDERIMEAAMNDPLMALRRQAAEVLAKRIGVDKACERLYAVVEDPKQYSIRYRYRSVQLIAHL